MCQETIDAVFSYCQLGVVVIVGVDADSIGEGRESYRRFQGRSDDRCTSGSREPGGFQVFPNDRTGLGDGTGQCKSDAVQDGLARQFEDRRGNIGEVRVNDEGCRVGRGFGLLCRICRGRYSVRHQTRAHAQASPAGQFPSCHEASLTPHTCTNWRSATRGTTGNPESGAREAWRAQLSAREPALPFGEVHLRVRFPHNVVDAVAVIREDGGSVAHAGRL